jgi:hypothetical protein
MVQSAKGVRMLTCSHSFRRGEREEYGGQIFNAHPLDYLDGVTPVIK